MIEVFHGDAREILRDLALDPTTTVVITDPPWPDCDVGINGGGDDAVPLWSEVAALLPSIADRLVLWLGGLVDPRGMLAAVPAIYPYATTVWLRFVPPGYRGCFMSNDVAHVFGKMRMPAGCKMLPGESTAKDPREMRARRLLMHPCPRSIEHARWLVNWYAAKAKTIVDPFCGSGTTLVAAAELGLDAIGIENDARWVLEARERTVEAQAQQLLGGVR